MYKNATQQVPLIRHVKVTINSFVIYSCTCADPERFLRGGGVQIPRWGLKENFNMTKINNLAIPGGGGSGPPVPPLDPPMTYLRRIARVSMIMSIRRGLSRISLFKRRTCSYVPRTCDVPATFPWRRCHRRNLDNLD